MYRVVESYCTPKTNTAPYVNYASIKKKKKDACWVPHSCRLLAKLLEEVQYLSSVGLQSGDRQPLE